MAGLMSALHKEIIDVELRREFIRDLILDEEFLSVMRKDNCITEDMMEQVQIKLRLNGKPDGISEFLTRLKKRPEKAFKQFVRALIETRQDHLAALIDGELVRNGEQAMSPDIMNPPADNTDKSDEVDRSILLKKITAVVEKTDMDLSALTITPMPASVNKSRVDRKSSYGDSARQSGRVIILNNDYVLVHGSREGSAADVKNLTNLFKQFKFDIITEEDKSAKEMIEILDRESRREDLANIDILIVILMSHGKSNVIFGGDGKSVTIHPDVTALFSNENCPHMTGKPKLFIIQACQKESLGEPAPMPDFHNPDTYVAMAAVAGDSAFRIPTGSSFIRAIVCAIAKCSHSADIRDMIALASDAVRNAKIKQNKIQLPKGLDTLSKDCYLIHPDSIF